MSWTAPRTWSNGEVATATMLNEQVRDNLAVLKVSRDDFGRVSALSAATVDDLSAANITGIARPGVANTFTAGRTRFTETATLVVPVGTDLYEDLGGGLRRGIWIEGDYFHHIAADQTTEYRFLGTVVSTPPGAVVGSLWVEGDYLHYIDADGDERRCQSVGIGTLSAHNDAGAIGGSVWVETYFHWIRESGAREKPGHADVSHSDGTAHSDTHADVSHVDGAHGDTGHADSHGDASHSDAHSDSHLDTSDPHADSHGDTHADTEHTDSHTDTAHADNAHGDSHTDSHEDHSDHDDVAAQSQPTVVV